MNTQQSRHTACVTLFILFVLSLLNPEGGYTQYWEIDPAIATIDFESEAEVLGDRVWVQSNTLFQLPRPGEYLAYTFAKKAINIIWQPVIGHGVSWLWIRGIGTPVIQIFWQASAYGKFRGEDDTYIFGPSWGDTDLFAALPLNIGDFPAGGTVDVNTFYSVFSTSNFSPEMPAPEDEAWVRNTALDLQGVDLLEPALPSGFDIINRRDFVWLQNQRNSMPVAGPAVTLDIVADAHGEINWEGFRGTDWMWKDYEVAGFWGNMFLMINQELEDTLAPRLLFSLDIGSDTELSDPNQDGDEVFDPGDMYESLSAALPPGGWDGVVDDSLFFDLDPAPSPPDGPPPVSRAPTCLALNSDSLAISFFDLDGYDALDFSLLGSITGPLTASIDTSIGSRTVFEAMNLLISYDDDWSSHYTGDTWSCDVPVMNPNPDGSRVDQNEINSLTVLPLITAQGSVQYVAGAFLPNEDEISIHASLVPNPDTTNIDNNDDIDALDVQYQGFAFNYDFHYFSVDHEATYKDGAGQPLEPGAIYMATRNQTLQKVIDPGIHLGLPAGTDVDAFEFAWLFDPKEGRDGLALIFSVDDFDWLSATDNSGGQDPTIIYFSFLTGSFDTLVVSPRNADIDAITCEWAPQLNLIPFVPTINGSVGDAEMLQPNTFELGQNYPNPFNNGTRFQFKLGRGQTVRASITDATGRLIKMLSNEHWEAGRHTLSWDGTDDSGKRTSSGVYMIRLDAGDVSLVKKCLQLK